MKYRVIVLYSVIILTELFLISGVGMASCPPEGIGDSGGSGAASSVDPNELTGPAGYGDKHFIPFGTVHSYRIDFENDATATYAGEATITGFKGFSGYDTIYLSGANTNLDLTTLTKGVESIEQISMINGQANQLTVSNSVIDSNGAPFTVRMDAGDTIAWESVTLAYSADQQTVIWGTNSANLLKSTSLNDSMHGRAGSDTFTWLPGQSGRDTVKDFSVVQGDKLDISELLSGYDAATDNLSEWVTSYTSDGTNTTLEIDLDNSGVGDTATQTIVLENVDLTITYADLNSLANSNVLNIK